MRSEIFTMLRLAWVSVSDWFTQIFTASDMIGVYLGAIVIVLAIRLLVAPFLGATINTGASDTVRTVKENMRYHGKFEKNQSGKYSK